MVFLLFVSVFFSRTPYLLLIDGRSVAVGGEELKKASSSTPSVNEPARAYFSPHSTAKTNDKITNLRKNDM